MIVKSVTHALQPVSRAHSEHASHRSVALRVFHKKALAFEHDMPGSCEQIRLASQKRRFENTSCCSHLDTPRTDAPITNATTIIPRQAEPNMRFPAFLDGSLSWGTLPVQARMIQVFMS